MLHKCSMKKAGVCFFLIIMVCLSGCSHEYPPDSSAEVQETNTNSSAGEESTEVFCPTESKRTESNNDILETYINRHQDEILSYLWIPGGGVLLMMKTPSEGGTDAEAQTAEMYQIMIKGEHPDVRQLRLTGPVAGKVPIFYDEDWVDRYEDENHQIITSYDSGFVSMDGQNENLLLIEVFPNRVNGVSYADSEFYGIKPWDSLDTVPMEVYTPEWNEGYPAWFFVIDPKGITADYEMHYGAFALTGTDILTGTWTIGEAPQFPVFE